MFKSQSDLSESNLSEVLSIPQKRNSRTRSQLTPFENAMVGVVGGITETTLQMPLLTWKYCIQEGRAYPKTPRGWMRGVSVQAGSLAPITAFQVLMNGVFERLVTRGVRDLKQIESIGTACAAGACSALIYGPADLMVIQQQKLELNSAFATFKSIRARYGSLSLFRGISSTCVRESIYTGCVLGLAPIVFNMFKDQGYSEVLCTVGAGIISGSIAALTSHPVDTGKTVMQADIGKVKYKTATQVISEFYKTKGIRSLYFGGLPRTLRITGACIIVASIRESAIRYRTLQEFGPGPI